MNMYFLKFDIFKALGKWNGTHRLMLNEPLGIQQANYSSKTRKNSSKAQRSNRAPEKKEKKKKTTKPSWQQQKTTTTTPPNYLSTRQRASFFTQVIFWFQTEILRAQGGSTQQNILV